MDTQDKQYLRIAIEQSQESISKGGFPAGAIVVKENKIIGRGISIGNILNDPTSHGEMASIRQACGDLKATDLSGATLYASMQPCLMCFGAAVWSGISRIVFACPMRAVNKEYYGGNYCLSDLNRTLLRPVELEHYPEMEDEALKIVRQWEASIS